MPVKYSILASHADAKPAKSSVRSAYPKKKGSAAKAKKKNKY